MFFLSLSQFLYVLLPAFLIEPTLTEWTMNKGLLFVVLLVFACSLCVTNSGCTDKKPEVGDSIVADSLPADSAAADSTEEIIAETPMPKAADELFDDFVFNFASNKKLQLERVDFPLPVYKNGELMKTVEKSKWRMERFFMRQGYYTLLFDSWKHMNVVKDTAVAHVVVEKIFFDIKTVQKFVFDRVRGEWRMKSICYEPIYKNSNANFLKFYERFATDSLFQIESMADEVKFTAPDPDDDFSTMTGWMMPGQWPDFKPALIPEGPIYNIIYGEQYPESNTKIFVVRGISNGLEIEMVFKRQKATGQWLLTEFSS